MLNVVAIVMRMCWIAEAMLGGATLYFRVPFLSIHTMLRVRGLGVVHRREKSVVHLVVDREPVRDFVFHISILGRDEKKHAWGIE